MVAVIPQREDIGSSPSVSTHLKELMNLPSDLSHLFHILSQVEGSTTRLVGGCVRDFILGKTPKDFDIVTDIDMDTLEEVLAAEGWYFDPIGKQFLVLNVSRRVQVIGGGAKIKIPSYEIANFRKDGVYLDGRRPEKTEVGTLEEDALRRDFTVNAIYYDPKTKEIYSPIKTAISDVAERKLKFIGKPKDRIQEDYLRVFRFYRFIQEKGLVADPKSLAACRQYFEEAVKNTSGERIRNEIERMVTL